jgi:hypothetical protein
LQDEIDNRITSGAVGNIIVNTNFNMALHGWFANSCIASICSVSTEDSRIESGVHALISNRTDSWQGLEQDNKFHFICSTKMDISSFQVSDRCMKVVCMLRSVPNLLLTFFDCIVLPSVSKTKTSIVMWLCLFIKGEVNRSFADGHDNIIQKLEPSV